MVYPVRVAPELFYLDHPPTRGVGGSAAWLRRHVASTSTLLDTEFTGRCDIPWGPHRGPLSVRVVLDGREEYLVEGRRKILNPGDVLVLNPRTEFASTTLRGAPTHVVTLFSAPGPVQKSWRERERASGRGGLFTPSAPLVSEHVRLHDADLGDPLRRLALAARRRDRSGIERETAATLQAIWRAREDDLRLADQRLCASKRSTRQDLYSRLHHARDFIHAHLSDPIELGDIARVAFMAPFYFHRRFSEVFGKPPGAYVRDLRLDTAARRAEVGADDVGSLAIAVGYRDPSAFTRAFRKRFGATPSAYLRGRVKLWR